MSFCLRKATIEDAQDILRWRNDPTTRENSFTKNKISLMSHMNWFGRKLADENCHIFILMDGEKKVGNIRVDVTDEVGEISYMIAPDARGKGYGKKIIALLEEELRQEETGVKTLTAFTLKENMASARCFEVNGFSCEDAGDSLCYSKSI